MLTRIGAVARHGDTPIACILACLDLDHIGDDIPFIGLDHQEASGRSTELIALCPAAPANGRRDSTEAGAGVRPGTGTWRLRKQGRQHAPQRRFAGIVIAASMAPPRRSDTIESLAMASPCRQQFLAATWVRSSLTASSRRVQWSPARITDSDPMRPSRR